jgi:uncharacterized protein YjbI with pentapeptide repeats
LKNTEKNIRWIKPVANEQFENLTFEELTVVSSSIENCQFIKVSFKHSTLGSKTTFKDCIFTNCQFLGMYTSLGNSTNYINCIFNNCDFNGKMLFMGAVFKNCRFSGKMKNHILINEKRFLSKPYRFENCDLSKVEFDTITFNGSRFFKNTKLPEKSIRLFRNENDILINTVLDGVKKLNIKEKADLEIIFNKDLRSGFNPFIIDILFLDEFLNESSRALFEDIVKDFEIKSS